MSYVDNVIESVVKKNPNEPEFIQAVTEVLIHCVLLSIMMRNIRMQRCLSVS